MGHSEVVFWSSYDFRFPDPEHFISNGTPLNHHEHDSGD